MTDINTNIKPCSYYYAAETFNDSKNIIESFLPLVEAIFHMQPQKITFSFLELVNKINEIYEVSILKATLIQLLFALKKQEKIQLDKAKRVTPNREIDFMLRLGANISHDEAKKLICDYIFTHTYELAKFISGEINDIDLDADVQKKYVPDLCNFLIEKRKEKKTLNITRPF